jgi:hypothetical protein
MLTRSAGRQRWTPTLASQDQPQVGAYWNGCPGQPLPTPDPVPTPDPLPTPDPVPTPDPIPTPEPLPFPDPVSDWDEFVDWLKDQFGW